MNSYVWYDVIRNDQSPYFGIRGRHLTKEGYEEEKTVRYVHIDYNQTLRILSILQQYQVPLIHMEDIISDMVN